MAEPDSDRAGPVDMTPDSFSASSVLKRHHNDLALLRGRGQPLVRDHLHHHL